ncbi:MAG: RidA family protein [Erysipelothrix sp.]|nr:RidA family protein [Erysipelothrix sp.]
MLSKVITSDDAPKAIGPYSQGIKLGDFVYLAGQIALDSNNQLSQGDIKQQTLQIINNIVSLLAEVNLELRHIVKTTVYLKDMDMFDDFNEIYATYFAHPYPARSTVEVSRLPKDALVEIDCFAIDTTVYEEKFGTNTYNSDNYPEVDCSECESGCCEDC